MTREDAVAEFKESISRISDFIRENRYAQEQIVKIKKMICAFCGIPNAENILEASRLAVKKIEEGGKQVPDLIELTQNLNKIPTEEDINEEEPKKPGEVIPLRSRCKCGKPRCQNCPECKAMK